MKIERTDLIKKNSTKYDGKFLFLLLFAFILIIVAFISDLRYSSMPCSQQFIFFEKINHILHLLCPQDSTYLEEIKCILCAAESDYCNMISTFNTMLMAAIIFFYSLMDNKRLGVPFRTIIVYKYGSYTVPALFLFTLLLTPLLLTVQRAAMHNTTIVMVIMMFILQIVAVYIILRCTSFSFDIKVILRKEYEQYMELTENSAEYDNAWLYWPRHLEHAIISDELSADKMRIVRYILWIPFYKDKKCKTMLKYTLPQTSLEKIYLFYYKNIFSVFQKIKEEQYKTARADLYLVFYEFINNLDVWFKDYNAIFRSEVNNDGAKIYHAIVSATMNAVLMSDVEEGEAFCNYVLNNCISKNLNKEYRLAHDVQLDLYVMFQKIIFEVNNRYVHSFNLIDLSESWHPLEAETLDFYAEIWNLWMNAYSFSNTEKMEFFFNAITTLQRKNNYSASIVSILLQREQKIRKRKI